MGAVVLCCVVCVALLSRLIMYTYMYMNDCNEHLCMCLSNLVLCVSQTRMPLALRVIFVWGVGPRTMRVGLRSASATTGERCVTMAGTSMMLWSCADN